MIENNNKMVEEIIKNNKRWQEELIKDNKREVKELPEDKNIEHLNQKIEDNGVKKNPISEKTEGKKMKIRGIIHPKKIKSTQEVLEMTWSGLINLPNLPIVDHREGINLKNYRRNLMKMFEEDHHVMMRRKVTNNVFKLNTPELDILPKRSEMLTIIMILGTYLCNKPDDEVIEGNLKINENFISAKWKSRMIARYVTRTEIIMNTTIIRTTRTDEVSNYG